MNYLLLMDSGRGESLPSVVYLLVTSIDLNGTFQYHGHTFDPESQTNPKFMNLGNELEGMRPCWKEEKKISVGKQRESSESILSTSP